MSRIVTYDHDPVVYAARHWQTDLWGPFPVDLAGRGQSGVQVAARVNHGRWLVDCPSDGCNGAYRVNPDDLRFWCVYCNTGWHQVVLPDDRRRIEGLLTARQVPATRNWEPGDDLQAENRERRDSEAN